MKRLFGILALAVLVAVALFAGDAYATDFFTAARVKGTNIFKNTKTLIFIVGAFGLMVLAVGAIFGKMAWKTFAYLAIGLLILVGAGAIVDYFAGDGNWATDMGDTLQNVMGE